jgi:nitrogen regulatory protein P-II 1
MKKIEALIKPMKLDETREALHALGVKGVMVSEVKVSRRQTAQPDLYRGKEYVGDFQPKMKIEAFLDDALLDRAIEVIQEAAHTGHSGDGRIFVWTIDEVIRIRTGERGSAAL